MSKVRIVNVESAELDSKGMHLRVIAQVDLDLRQMQERLRGAGPVTGVDPVDLQATALLPDILKEHLDLSPFTVENVELYAVTQVDSTVGLRLCIKPANKINSLPNLLSKYEAEIRDKLIDQLEESA